MKTKTNNFDKKNLARFLIYFLIAFLPFYIIPNRPFEELIEEYEREHPQIETKERAKLSDGDSKKDQLASASKELTELQRCLQTDLINQKIQSDKKNSLSVYFIAGRKNNIPPYELEQIAMLAGVDIPTFRSAVLNDKPNQTSLYRQSNKLAKINETYVDEIFVDDGGDKPAFVNVLPKIIDGSKIFDSQKMLQQLKKGQFDAVAESIKQAKKVPLLTSQFDPITAAILLRKDITFEDLQLLHDAGVPYTLASLAQLTKHSNGLSIIEKILAISPEIAFKERWKNGFYVVNLLTFSLLNNNIEQAQFWFNLGVSPRPIANGINALDAFPEFDKQVNDSNAKQFLVQLLREDIQPYKLETEPKIQTWFEEEPDILEDRSLTVQWHVGTVKNRNETVERMKMMFAKIENRNLRQASLNSEQFLLCTEKQQFLSEKKKLVENTRTVGEFTQLSPEENLKRLAELELDEAATPILEPIAEQLSGILWSSNELNTESAEIPEIVKVKRQQRIAAFIRSFESTEKIVALLEDGYSMNDETIHVIAQNGRIELIDPLMNYGLNVEAVNSQGQNALFSALTGFKPFETFNYLLEQKGLKIINGSQLLLHAIQLNAYDKNTPKIVEKLIRKGIKPNQYHWTALVHHVPAGSPVYRKISLLFEKQGKIDFE